MVVAVGPVEVLGAAVVKGMNELVDERGFRVRGPREVVVAEDDAIGRAEAAAYGLVAVLDADEGAGDGAAGLEEVEVVAERGSGEFFFEVEVERRRLDRGKKKCEKRKNSLSPRSASPS